MRFASVWLGLIALMLCTLVSPDAFGAIVSGTVVDQSAKGVGSINVSVIDPATHKVIGQATTNAAGKYEISGIAPGTYDFALDPKSTGFKGGSAVAAVPDNGLMIDWTVSSTADAIALATPVGALAAIGGTSAALAAAAAGAVIIGGTVGGLAAAGAFSGGGAGPRRIASPSL